MKFDKRLKYVNQQELKLDWMTKILPKKDRTKTLIRALIIGIITISFWVVIKILGKK